MNSKRTLFFAATNPCHAWDQARGLAALGEAVVFFSGYPRSRLSGDFHGAQVETYTRPTLFTYGITKLIGRSHRWARTLYRWQDIQFDRNIAAFFKCSFPENNDVVLGIPGQCEALFQAARSRGVITCLNHASGPVETQTQRINTERIRLGLETRAAPAEIHTRSRILEERRLADYHLCASTVTANQLQEVGIPSGKIITAPYGVDPDIFQKKPAQRAENIQAPFRVIFAGQTDIRKGIHWLIDAWKTLPHNPAFSLEICGPTSRWLSEALDRNGNPRNIRVCGPVSQPELAEKFRQCDLVILPSVEDAFGLVVPQALQCGTPVIVSEHVGAKDLIQSEDQGAIVGYGDTPALLEAMHSIRARRPFVSDAFDYLTAAKTLKKRLDAAL